MSVETFTTPNYKERQVLPLRSEETPTVQELREMVYGPDGYEEFQDMGEVISSVDQRPRSGLTERERTEIITKNFLETCKQLGSVSDLTEDKAKLIEVYQAYARYAPEAFALTSGHLPLVTGAILHSLANPNLKPEARRKLSGMLDDLDNGHLGVLMLTEGEHGTDASHIQTTATQDPETGEWIINTPAFVDRKFMPNVGDAGIPKVAVVAAQQYTYNKETGEHEHQGVSLFMVPIHAEDSPEGITVERMSDKPVYMGNAETTFTNVRLPAENWLPGDAYFDDDGVYQNPHASLQERYHSNIGALDAGRLGLSAGTVTSAQTLIALVDNYSRQRETVGGKKIGDLDHIQRKIAEAVVDTIAMTALINSVKKSFATDGANPLDTVRGMLVKGYVPGRAREIIATLGNTVGAHAVFNENLVPLHATGALGADIAEGEKDVMASVGGKLLAKYGGEDAVQTVDQEPRGQGDAADRDTWHRMVAFHETFLTAQAAESREKPSSLRSIKIGRAAAKAAALEAVLDAADTAEDETAKEILATIADIYALQDAAEHASHHVKEGRADVIGLVDDTLDEKYAKLQAHIPEIIKAFGVPEGLLEAPIAMRDYREHSLAAPEGASTESRPRRLMQKVKALGQKVKDMSLSRLYS